MQSSPPVRAFARRDSQPESEYSLDLNALDLDNDDTDTSIPKPNIERIMSEDIEGPSDFTQNMDMWMRGGSIKKKGTLRGRNATAQTTRDFREEAMRSRHEEYVSENDIRRDFLDVPQNELHLEDDHTGSHHTPENSPPKLSVLNRTGDEEQFSSEWQTDGEGSTPQPPAHKQFLPPTVEDYYSELTTAQQTPGQSRVRTYGTINSSLKQTLDEEEEDKSTPGRASSPTLSPVRSPILQRSSTQATLQRTSTHGTYGREADHKSRMEMEQQFKQLDAKCQQLEHLNDVLGHALDEERRTRKQEQVKYETSSAEAARREKDLLEMKEMANRHNEEFRREFAQLKEKFADQQTLAEMARKNASGDEQTHAIEAQALRGEIERLKLDHHLQIRGLQQDLEIANRSRTDAEQDVRMLRQEHAGERELHQEEVARLKAETNQAQKTENVLAQLERQLREARAEIARLKSNNVEAVDQLKTASEELEAAKHGRDDELDRAVVERSRAVELAAGFQRQMQELRQQMRDGKARHESEMARLRNSHEQNGQTSTQEIEVIRMELESKQADLNTAIFERDQAQDSLQNLASEVSSLKKKLFDQESVNSTLDLRVTDAIKKRETHWREKLEEANRERELMAKTLLHQWGKEEVGVESPQRYAYKYHSRSKTRSKSPDKENRDPSSPRKGSKATAA
ncbi:uncharacterized protein MYCFIDRAFT_196970 [Pseudocercospora fijiensis CIRAD86]|uniref:Uncharacterized protein n=1 Tax=Pseudocercospora fijiensis (strain CIRAD86) TaxID=383855 RepID=M3AWZ8_PSEFD|nr:uncharacterized protein MYCFIDRAFT_196970 [Pseudocercospora fijiensis CIRAD86]EME81623.1 hypothetical protein MYCFIDRAFT_196970 [Pseudocercospora fijiensis CIRAD86]